MIPPLTNHLAMAGLPPPRIPAGLRRTGGIWNRLAPMVGIVRERPVTVVANPLRTAKFPGLHQLAVMRSQAAGSFDTFGRVGGLSRESWTLRGDGEDYRRREEITVMRGGIENHGVVVFPNFQLTWSTPNWLVYQWPDAAADE
jgi:hypothetical protein